MENVSIYNLKEIEKGNRFQISFEIDMLIDEDIIKKAIQEMVVKQAEKNAV